MRQAQTGISKCKICVFVSYLEMTIKNKPTYYLHIQH